MKRKADGDADVGLTQWAKEPLLARIVELGEEIRKADKQVAFLKKDNERLGLKRIEIAEKNKVTEDDLALREDDLALREAECHRLRVRIAELEKQADEIERPLSDIAEAMEIIGDLIFQRSLRRREELMSQIKDVTGIDIPSGETSEDYVRRMVKEQ